MLPNLIYLLIFSITFLNAYDVPLFYRAHPLFQEPRIEKPYLTTLDFTISGGSTNCARNCLGNKVPLGDIYGVTNIKHLATDVPTLNVNDPVDSLLISLQTLPAQDGLGNISIHGQFEILELIFNGIQNFNNGFFAELLIPVRKLKVSKIKFIDLAPEDANNAQWNEFLPQLCPTLKKFNLRTNSLNLFSTGNVTLFLGWAKNYENTTQLDFIDTTLKIGLQLPTATRGTSNHIFNISTGYAGIGIPVVWSFAFGAFEWLTVGGQVDGLFLFSEHVPLRIKTSNEQSGLIKLFKDHVKLHRGTAWHIGPYIKADHIIRGFSLLLGYSYDRKDNDTVKKTKCHIDPCIVNTDPMLDEWSMHTLHMNADYDFECEENPYGPRIGLTVNKFLSGKKVFNTNLTSFYIGTDICWKF